MLDNESCDANGICVSYHFASGNTIGMQLNLLSTMFYLLWGLVLNHGTLRSNLYLMLYFIVEKHLVPILPACVTKTL